MADISLEIVVPSWNSSHAKGVDICSQGTVSNQFFVDTLVYKTSGKFIRVPRLI